MKHAIGLFVIFVTLAACGVESKIENRRALADAVVS